MDFQKIRGATGTIVEIDQDTYEHMLNVLPPIDAWYCFAMGEPVAHTSAGVTFYWAAKRGDRFFAFYGTRAEAESVFAM